MDPKTLAFLMGAAGGASKLYVEDVFSTWLYTGNGSTQTITNGIDLSGKGGLVWIKQRSSVADHFLFDTARGARNHINSNNTGAQETAVGNTDLYQYNSDGFTLGANYWGGVNTSSETYASWTFRKAAKFFDVVTYTGNGSNRTIAHNLGSVPGCIIVKRTDSAADWQVYHRSLANTEYLVLNSTAAKATGATRWNSTTPTSTEFSLGTDTTVNASGGTYVAYLFAHDAGGFGDSGNDSVVKCGSFAADGSGNATIDLGWEPQWILIKRSSTSGTWAIYDNMRGMPTGSNFKALLANAIDAEADGPVFNLTPTGITHTGGGLSGTYIYIAIRRGPMKTPTDATKVFSAITATGGSGTTRTVGFPADLYLATRRAEAFGFFSQDRLRGFEESDTTGKPILYTASTAAEVSNQNPFAYQIWNTSARDGSQGLGSSNLWYYLRRAPGFFDVVAYTGTGSARTVSHNLGVAPELMLVKARGAAAYWRWYWAPLGATKNCYIPNNEAAITQTEIWNDTAPTSSVFTVGTSTDTNFSGRTYIAYLFASCPGVSKVGSYTGTGTTLNVDCGFTNGARFVLIKRSDSTGDWYVWDTARGIVSGNDPYLLLNSTAAEVNNTDYIDPLSAGFQISSTAPAAINASGGTFIFLAIA